MNIQWPIPGCRVEQVTADTPALLQIAAHGMDRGGRCPDCGTVSRAVHNRYCRYLADLPALGRMVPVSLRVRRFYCRNAACPRQTFADPDARFKFVPAKGYVPEPGELRFDMFEAEFTHEGDNCTYEVLLTRAGLSDPAFAVIGEIVHDIDLKDGKFGREEASGIARLVDGIAATTEDDGRRIERGSAMLDDLYEYYRTARV